MAAWASAAQAHPPMPHVPGMPVLRPQQAPPAPMWQAPGYASAPAVAMPRPTHQTQQQQQPQPMYRQMPCSAPKQAACGSANAINGAVSSSGPVSERVQTTSSVPPEEGFRRRRGEGRSFGGGPSSINIGGGPPEDLGSPRVTTAGSTKSSGTVSTTAPSTAHNGGPDTARNCASPSRPATVASARKSSRDYGGFRGAGNLVGPSSGGAKAGGIPDQAGGGGCRMARSQLQPGGTKGSSASVPPPRGGFGCSGREVGGGGGGQSMLDDVVHTPMTESSFESRRRHSRPPSPPSDGRRRRGEGRSSGGGPTSISLFGGDPASGSSPSAVGGPDELDGQRRLSKGSRPSAAEPDYFDVQRHPSQPYGSSHPSGMHSARHSESDGFRVVHRDGEVIGADGYPAAAPKMPPHMPLPRTPPRGTGHTAPAGELRPSYEDLVAENRRLRAELAEVSSELAVYRRWYDGLVGSGSSLAAGGPPAGNNYGFGHLNGAY